MRHLTLLLALSGCLPGGAENLSGHFTRTLESVESDCPNDIDRPWSVLEDFYGTGELHTILATDASPWSTLDDPSILIWSDTLTDWNSLVWRPQTFAEVEKYRFWTEAPSLQVVAEVTWDKRSRLTRTETMWAPEGDTPCMTEVVWTYERVETNLPLTTPDGTIVVLPDGTVL